MQENVHAIIEILKARYYPDIPMRSARCTTRRTMS